MVAAYDRPSAFERRARRRARLRLPLAFAAFAASAGFFLVNIVDPYSGAVASPDYRTTGDPYYGQPVQTLTVAATSASTGATISRDSYKIVVPPPPAPVVVAPTTSTAKKSSGGSGSSSAPSAAVPDPGTAQAIAYQMLQARGMGDDQYSCLVSLWNRESGWRVNAANRSSGAYGIPQALPGSKMASVGADWQTNPATQITWGLGYITGRYGTPCGAWGHSQSSGWY